MGTLPLPVSSPEDLSVPGFVGRIPVRNLWLLMYYASEFRRLRGAADVGVENAPDDLPDLVAELLADAVERRLRRLLSRGYQRREAALTRVRGRIDALETERRQLLRRGLIACRFEELAVDTPRNRFVRAACGRIGNLVRTPDLRLRCRRAAATMRALGVSGNAPARWLMSTDTIGRHEADDRQMVAAAALALDLALPTEHAGTERLPLAEREEHWVRLLFERAVRGFYEVTLQRQGWRVGARKLHWQIQEATPGVMRILPGMRTDMTLEHPDGRRVVVDTKFTGITTRGQFGQTALRSGHVFQIYAYVFSQLRPRACEKDAGVVLHPAIDETVDETAVIQGRPFRFLTVDLAADAGEIGRQLLRVIKTPANLAPWNAG